MATAIVPQEKFVGQAELFDPPSDADRQHWAEATRGEWDAPDIPSEPRLPFPEFIETQASWFRSFGHDAADFLTSQLDQIAATARYLKAKCPADFDSRAALCERREGGAA